MFWNVFAFSFRYHFLRISERVEIKLWYSEKMIGMINFIKKGYEETLSFTQHCHIKNKIIFLNEI